jgi:outer membrane protein TolC
MLGSAALAIIIIIASLLPRIVRGQDEPVITLTELLETAMRLNPDVLAAEEAVHAGRHRAQVAGGYPDLFFGYTYFVESIETRLGPQQSVFNLVQPVPFPGKLSLKQRVAAYDAELLEQRLFLTKLNIRKAVKEAYYSIAAVEEVIASLQEVRDIVERLEGILTARLESGTVYEQDILKIQVEKLKIDERILNYEKRRRSLIAALNALVAREPHHQVRIEPIGAVTELPHTEEQLQDLALRRPELVSNELLIEKNERALSLAKRKYLPDFTLGASYFQIGKAPADIPRSGEDAWNISIGMQIPLWFGKVRSEVKERESMARHLERNLEAAKLRTKAEINDQYGQYLVALELLHLYTEDLVPRAKASLESALAGYMTGEVDFLSVLDSERLLVELGISLAERKAEVERRIAEIEALVGRELVERR